MLSLTLSNLSDRRPDLAADQRVVRAPGLLLLLPLALGRAPRPHRGLAGARARPRDGARARHRAVRGEDAPLHGAAAEAQGRLPRVRLHEGRRPPHLGYVALQSSVKRPPKPPYFIQNCPRMDHPRKNTPRTPQSHIHPTSPLSLVIQSALLLYPRHLSNPL